MQRCWNCVVADAQDFVDQQDLGLEVGGDGECEANVHPTRIALHGHVDEATDSGEVDDVVELRSDLPAPHSEECAVQVDVVTAAQLRVEAGADLEERADSAVDVQRRPRSAR